MSQNKNAAPHEISGHFAFDRVNGLPVKDPYGVLTRGDGNPFFHGDETLYGQRSGIIDEATGERLTDEFGVDEELFSLEGLNMVTNEEPEEKSKLEMLADLWLKHNGDPSQ